MKKTNTTTTNTTNTTNTTTVPAKSTVIFSGAEKVEFARIIAQAFAEGKTVTTPAGVVIPPLVAKGGVISATFDNGSTIAPLALNRIFSAVRLAQKTVADDCDLVRQFAEWTMTPAVMGVADDDYAEFAYDLARLAGQSASVWAVRLIRKYITTSLHVSREKGIPGIFWFRILNNTFYLRVTGAKYQFSKDEKSAWQMMSAVHQ